MTKNCLGQMEQSLLASLVPKTTDHSEILSVRTVNCKCSVLHNNRPHVLGVRAKGVPENCFWPTSPERTESAVLVPHIYTESTVLVPQITNSEQFNDNLAPNCSGYCPPP